jgi:hypothetical protein
MFLCLFFGLWSWSGDKLYVKKLNFYKPTFLKIQPPINEITAHATTPGRFEHCIISFLRHTYDPNKCCWKNSLLSEEFKLNQALSKTKKLQAMYV